MENKRQNERETIKYKKKSQSTKFLLVEWILEEITFIFFYILCVVLVVQSSELVWAKRLRFGGLFYIDEQHFPNGGRV